MIETLTLWYFLSQVIPHYTDNGLSKLTIQNVVVDCLPRLPNPGLFLFTILSISASNTQDYDRDGGTR